MKKTAGLFVLAMVAVCGIALAVKVSPLQKIVTITNTSVAYGLSSDSSFTTSEYTISAGANNTGTIYVGTSAVSPTAYGTYLNAGDTVSMDKTNVDYTLSDVYIRGSVVNDTASVLYNNV